MVDENDIRKFLRADYFLFQKIQNHTWETVNKSSSLEEVKKEFALNYRIELNGKFRIIYYSFDNSRQSWGYKVALLVNTNYFNQPFIEFICKTLDNVALKKSTCENYTQTIKDNPTNSELNTKKKSHRTLILAIAVICFLSSCATVGGVLYFKFPLVFQQVTELIFS
tara:strand:+ start:393 stop:893 length:501 start_codon:yes stop_codon:yes gene_type:complete